MVVYKQGVPDFNRFRVIKDGTIDMSAFSASGSAFLTRYSSGFYTHSLGFKPVFFVYFELPSGAQIPLPYYDFNLDTGALGYQIIPTITVNNLIVEVRSTANLSPWPVPLRYYLCSDKTT